MQYMQNNLTLSLIMNKEHLVSPGAATQNITLVNFTCLKWFKHCYKSPDVTGVDSALLPIGHGFIKMKTFLHGQFNPCLWIAWSLAMLVSLYSITPFNSYCMLCLISCNVSFPCIPPFLSVGTVFCALLFVFLTM